MRQSRCSPQYGDATIVGQRAMIRRWLPLLPPGVAHGRALFLWRARRGPGSEGARTSKRPAATIDRLRPTRP
jgi:hypothetical protein